jgi:hypothetical protein
MAFRHNDGSKGWHCLRIPEILERTAAELEDSDGYQACCAALFGLGLTCKALLDPAMDLLWMEQKGLTQLIKTLPSDILKQSPPPSEDEEYPPPIRHLVSTLALIASYDFLMRNSLLCRLSLNGLTHVNGPGSACMPIA